MMQFLLSLLGKIVAIAWSLMQVLGLGGAGAAGPATSPATSPSTPPSSSGPAVSAPARPDHSGRAGGQPRVNSQTVQTDGVVLINTIINYNQGIGAGTGLVVGADGIVVTNHHVVQGSTQVSVTVPQTGQTYKAQVLGYSATDDVAVLQLQDATGLVTISAGNEPVSVGDSVTAVGNAGGTGTLTATTGQVTALGQTITATDQYGNDPEQLTGLIQISATLQPGDSGGALLNTASDVVGMNVAGSAYSRASTSYVIPFGTVDTVLEQVMAGKASSTVTMGYPAALGVIVMGQGGGGGIYVRSTVSGGAADQAGVTAGSRLTSLGGKTLNTATDLSDVLAKHSPGDVVSLTWIDVSGRKQAASVTLGEGPLA